LSPAGAWYSVLRIELPVPLVRFDRGGVPGESVRRGEARGSVQRSSVDVRMRIVARVLAILAFLVALLVTLAAAGVAA
jgi:hypothetical protein